MAVRGIIRGKSVMEEKDYIEIVKKIINEKETANEKETPQSKD